MPRSGHTANTAMFRRSRARTIVLVGLVLLTLLDTINSIPYKRSLVRLCSKDLSDALYLACKDRGYNEPFSYSGEDDPKDSVGPGLAEECCYHQCSYSQLEQYCKPNRTNPTDAVHQILEKLGGSFLIDLSSLDPTLAGLNSRNRQIMKNPVRNLDQNLILIGKRSMLIGEITGQLQNQLRHHPEQHPGQHPWLPLGALGKSPLWIEKYPYPSARPAASSSEEERSRSDIVDYVHGTIKCRIHGSKGARRKGSNAEDDASGCDGRNSLRRHRIGHCGCRHRRQRRRRLGKVSIIIVAITVSFASLRLRDRLIFHVPATKSKDDQQRNALQQDAACLQHTVSILEMSLLGGTSFMTRF
ncbi:Insulin-like peptide [Eufriesea mexicana]|uniref:Insulin-like peptide n=1 Tax=Eufriesea mexicana TaxID=516756 RepID=A0A310SBU9_9HYME|nr:Insulin-like peptide [Eufriesea mexicana]